MTPVKFIILAGSLILLIVMYGYSSQFKKADPPVKGIVALELADRQEGQEILASWRSAEPSLLQAAYSSTWWDFLFIIFYTAFLVMISNSLVYREPSVALNNFLRMNVFLSFITGLLDVAENILIFRNLDRAGTSDYISTAFLSWPKFILAAWIILFWLFALVRNVIRK